MYIENFVLKIVTIRDFFFADDAVLEAISAQDLQTILSQFYSVFSDFGVAISFKKTKVLSKGIYKGIFYQQSKSMVRISKI